MISGHPTLTRMQPPCPPPPRPCPALPHPFCPKKPGLLIPGYWIIT